MIINFFQPNLLSFHLVITFSGLRVDASLFKLVGFTLQSYNAPFAPDLPYGVFYAGLYNKNPVNA